MGEARPVRHRHLMNDSFAARRYIAEAIGKTKNPVTAAAGELARLLTRDFTEVPASARRQVRIRTRAR
jgi:hypothetical protein